MSGFKGCRLLQIHGSLCQVKASLRCAKKQEQEKEMQKLTIKQLPFMQINCVKLDGEVRTLAKCLPVPMVIRKFYSLQQLNLKDKHLWYCHSYYTLRSISLKLFEIFIICMLVFVQLCESQKSLLFISNRLCCHQLVCWHSFLRKTKDSNLLLKSLVLSLSSPLIHSHLIILFMFEDSRRQEPVYHHYYIK